MPRLSHPLNKAEVAQLALQPGSHPVGGSLFLLVRGPGRAYWVHRYRDPKRTNGSIYSSEGFGSYPKVSLAQARKRLDEANVTRRNGAEMPRKRSQAVAGESFAQVAMDYLNHHADEWSAKSLARYRTLLKYAASLDNVPVNLITTRQIADVLRPIWDGPTNRGGKLRSLIERILTGKVTPNPAAWNVLSLPEYKLALKAPETKSHPAMPASEIPAFVRRLDMKRAADRAILLVILTGVRRSEATGATWGEFDLANKRWLIPAARMKTGKDHFVPLSDAAIACVGELGAPNDLVFSGAQGHDALRLSKRFGLPYDLHGFRTSFGSWAEENGYRTNVIQMMLAHRKKDDKGHALGSQDTAYMRATLFEERRNLHDAWAALVISGTR